MELIQDDKTYILESDQSVEVYENGRLVAAGSGRLTLGQFALHPVFEIHTGTKVSWLARRDIPECGIVNLRDLGGYRTKNGRVVRYRQFYRGAALLPQNEAQKQAVDALKLHTIIDFRSDREIAGREDYISTGTRYEHHSGLKILDDPKTQGNFDFSYLVKSGNIFELQDYMARMYEDMAIDNPAFIALLNHMVVDETPLYFHCSAGKDRTGVGAMLILLCLGVDEKTVMEDYLLSNVYRQAANEAMLDRIDQNYREQTRPLYYVSKQYLERTLTSIKTAYGDLDAYFTKTYGLTPEKRMQLQEKYCY